jgi:hypothetical protein
MIEARTCWAERALPRRTRSTGFAVAIIALSATIGGCASSAPPVAQPPIDAGQVALSAERSSSLDAPYRLVFEWSLTEAGARLNGRGVARVEPPYRARLDLFLSNGERVAAAAMVGEDFRIAAGGRTELPSPAFLWGALGVFRPGDFSALRGGRWQSNGEAELRYQFPAGGDLLYHLSGSRIQRMELLRGERPAEEVRLIRVDGERFPRAATYRHLEQVRELRITLESVEHVEAYPSDIWDPGA